jgi:hypothetical protein
MTEIANWGSVRSERNAYSIKAPVPQLVREVAAQDPDPEFPTDVPAPEPHDVPAPEPIDPPATDPGDPPERKGNSERPEQPKPRSVP